MNWGNFQDEEFKKELKKYEFIKGLEIFPFTSNPLSTKMINTLVVLKGFITKAFYGTKLTPDDKHLPENISRICKKPKVDKPFVMVNLNKNNPTNSYNEEYGKTVVMNIFPMIQSRIVIAGTPMSTSDWDRIALVRYQSEESFCQMVQSQEYQQLVHLKKEGLEDSYTSMTTTLMAYEKDLLQN